MYRGKAKWMNDQELILTVVVELVILAFLMKFWRVILGLGVVNMIISAVLFLSEKFDCPIGNVPNRSSQLGGGRPFQTPNSAVINSVYQYLPNKTYSDYDIVNCFRKTPCSHFDDDFDPVGKGNPNAGKCRGTRGYEYGYKKKIRAEKVSVNIQCPSPLPLTTRLGMSNSLDKIYGLCLAHRDTGQLKRSALGL